MRKSQFGTLALEFSILALLSQSVEGGGIMSICQNAEDSPAPNLTRVTHFKSPDPVQMGKIKPIEFHPAPILIQVQFKPSDRINSNKRLANLAAVDRGLSEEPGFQLIELPQENLNELCELGEVLDIEPYWGKLDKNTVSFVWVTLRPGHTRADLYAMEAIVTKDLRQYGDGQVFIMYPKNRHDTLLDIAHLEQN